MAYLRLFLIISFTMVSACGSVAVKNKATSQEARELNEFIVIAHRGASGYLPEHTLESVSMAYAMGADFIEQDVVMTRDDELIVMHDLSLDAMTDVADRFPARARQDGRFYAVDFDLAEIRTLRVHERLKPNGKPAFPNRFPPAHRLFGIPTLAEEILLIQGLNASAGRQTGLYVEPKAPAWHLAEGKDLLAAVIDELARHGYQARTDPVFLQSFDMDALKRARFELRSELKLVQLIGENAWAESDTDFDYLRTKPGLSEIAGFADGIGPWLPHVIVLDGNSTSDISDIVIDAHALGLFVHAYTLRADQLPAFVPDVASAMRILVEQSGLDGVFTDHPDQAVTFLNADK